MKGIVDKVWENKTDDGKVYLVVRIRQNKYSVWDKKHMEDLNEGAAVEYEYTQSGKFKKITDMKKIELEPGFDPLERRSRDRNGQEIVRKAHGPGLAVTHFIKPDRISSINKLALSSEGEKENI